MYFYGITGCLQAGFTYMQNQEDEVGECALAGWEHKFYWAFMED